MRNIKRLFLSIVALLFVISVASCDNSKRNTSTPMGSISNETTVATAGDLTPLKNDVYYSQLRNQGYNTVLNNIKANLFDKEIKEVKATFNFSDSTVNDYERELFDSYASSLFGTTDSETVKDLTEADLNKNIAKFVDTCNNEGILIESKDIQYSLTNDKVEFTAVPEAIINKYIINIAINKAAKDELKNIVDKEEIEKDGKLVTNTNYIDEDAIETYYNNNNKKYGTYQAIVIQFNTLTEAEKFIGSTEITDANALAFYVNLYNTYYNYRTHINGDTPFMNYGNVSTKTVFEVNADKNELSEISSSVQNIVTNTLKENEYLTKPFNKNNKYVMVYRGEAVFQINEKYGLTTDKDGYVTWDTLKTNQNAYNEVRAEIVDSLIDSKVSSYTTTVINNRIEAADIKIFDPLFEMKFEGSYADYYDYINADEFENDKIYTLTYKDVQNTYTVEQFYTEQTQISGTKIIFSELSNIFAYSLKDLFVTEETIDTLTKEVENAVKSFNKNENTAYPKEIGLETFLVANYGYTNTDAVIENKIAQSALTSYLSDSLFDEWAEADHTITKDPSKLHALNNILATGNTKYNDIFSINIDHILIFIDDNGDGNPDDPKQFLKNFESEEAIKAYEDALGELAKAIYNEANCDKLTKSNDLMEILNYIVEAYTMDKPLFSVEDKTWADYKKYNFILKVESLSTSGDTTQSNVGNYVKEFGDYVKTLYDTLVKESIKIEDKEPVFIFPSTTKENKGPKGFDDLCATQFGYHMIVVNDYEERGSTKSLEKDDSNNYQKNVEVLINEKDKDTRADNIYVIVDNTYNNNTNAANFNQFFVYYVQKQTNTTSTLVSEVQTVLSAMFDDAISRYLSTGFQNYLLYNRLNATIVLENPTLAKQYANYKGYLARNSQSYDANDEFAAWYADTMVWTRPY